MKTDDLIGQLSTDLQAAKKHYYAASFLMWLAGTLGILTLTFHFLPFRPDLAERLSSPFFVTTTVLCFVIFCMSVFVSYRSAIPGLLQTRDHLIGIVLLIITAGVLLSQLSSLPLQSEFLGEMDWYRGRCGPIMLIIGTLDTALLMVLARRAAPVRPIFTGVWIALAAGAMGLFVMQFICTYENFLHVLLWHMLPVGILITVGALSGRKLLRW
jgi:hypothetical protein